MYLKNLRADELSRLALSDDRSQNLHAILVTSVDPLPMLMRLKHFLNDN
jgi:hypothetical protein